MSREKMLLDMGSLRGPGIITSDLHRRIQHQFSIHTVYIPIVGIAKYQGSHTEIQFRFTGAAEHIILRDVRRTRSLPPDFGMRDIHMMIMENSSHDLIRINGSHLESYFDYVRHAWDLTLELGTESGRIIKMRTMEEFIHGKDMAHLRRDPRDPNHMFYSGHPEEYHREMMRQRAMHDRHIAEMKAHDMEHRRQPFWEDPPEEQHVKEIPKEKKLHEDILIVQADKEVKNFKTNFIL